MTDKKNKRPFCAGVQQGELDIMKAERSSLRQSALAIASPFWAILVALTCLGLSSSVALAQKSKPQEHKVALAQKNKTPEKQVEGKRSQG